MKHIIIIIIIISGFTTAFAQNPAAPIKISFTNKDKLVVIRGLDASLYIEGYDGDEITIEPYNMPASKTPAEAAGLKNITALTKRAIAEPDKKIKPVVTKTPEKIAISLGSITYKALLIKVPKATHLKINYFTIIPNTVLSLKNLTGELETDSNAPLTEVDNIVGPLTLSSRGVTNAKIKVSNVKWNATQTDNTKYLLYVSSSAGDFDISLPADLKATFNIHSSYGGIYSDFDLIRKYPESNFLNYFKGDLNGGGAIVSVTAEYGDVFIRKQK